jgi:transposase-like protein
LLSDAKQRANKSTKLRKTDAPTNVRWSDKQKLEACTMYFMVGDNLSLISKTLNISYETLKVWKTSNWWKELEKEIRKEERLELSTRLKKAIDKSWDIVADRLEHGDHVYNQKTGEIIRKPVVLRDAANVAKSAVELREKLNLEENHTIAAEHITDKLNKLAVAFTNLSKGIVTPPPAEDIDFVERTDDAVHEEREA